MRKTRKTLAIIAAFCLIAVVARADIFDDIAGAIRSGNATEVAKYFDTNVEMMTADKSSVYSRNQAEMVLNEFFSNNSPKNFTIIHRGSSAKGARYAIGTLETARDSFRVYLYIKEVGGKLFIQEIRFEKE